MVSRPAGLSVTLYVSPNLYGQAFLSSAPSISSESPRSILTVLSAFLLSRSKDSEVELPRNSQVEFRAKPCWGSLDVAWLEGGGPKTCVGGSA